MIEKSVQLGKGTRDMQIKNPRVQVQQKSSSTQVPNHNKTKPLFLRLHFDNGSSVTHCSVIASLGCHHRISLFQHLLPEAAIRNPIYRRSQSQTLILQSPSQEASLQTPFLRQGVFQSLLVSLRLLLLWCGFFFFFFGFKNLIYFKVWFFSLAWPLFFLFRIKTSVTIRWIWIPWRVMVMQWQGYASPAMDEIWQLVFDHILYLIVFLDHNNMYFSCIIVFPNFLSVIYLFSLVQAVKHFVKLVSYIPTLYCLANSLRWWSCESIQVGWCFE